MYLMYLIEVQSEVQSEVQIKNNDNDFHWSDLQVSYFSTYSNSP